MESKAEVPVIVPGRPKIVPIYQLVASSPALEEDPEPAFELASSICWRWLAKKFFNDTEIEPPTESYFRSYPGQNLEVRILSEPRLWIARLEQPDTPFMGRQAAPGRNWRTDISLSIEEGRIKVGINVIAATVGDALSTPVFLTRPRAAVELSSSLHLSEIRELSSLPWIITSEVELCEMLALLQSSARTIPVIVITEPIYDSQVSTEMVDGSWLAEETQTLAHVVVIPNELTRTWTDLVTKRWSVFGGAVRTYWPRIDFESDSEHRHPLVVPRRIREWEFDAITVNGPKYYTGAEAFQRFLLERVKGHSATKYIQHPIYIAEARALEARQKREKAQQDSQDDHFYYEQEIDSITKKLDEEKRDNEVLLEKLIAIEDSFKSLENMHMQLKHRYSVLCSEMEQRKEYMPAEIEEVPLDYPTLCAYVDSKLIQGLILHERAQKGLKKSVYKDPLLVYKALELLATKYVSMKKGFCKKSEFEAGYRELGLDLAITASDTAAGREGDEYFVVYGGRKEFLKYHLTDGISRENRYCLRIYFFWDIENEMVVIGWLTTHLDTRNT